MHSSSDRAEAKTQIFLPVGKPIGGLSGSWERNLCWDSNGKVISNCSAGNIKEEVCTFPPEWPYPQSCWDANVQHCYGEPLSSGNTLLFSSWDREVYSVAPEQCPAGPEWKRCPPLHGSWLPSLWFMTKSYSRSMQCPRPGHSVRGRCRGDEFLLYRYVGGRERWSHPN